MAERSGTRLARVALRTQSDARLVTLTREGHDAAYEEIVRRHRARLVRQAAAIVPAHRAEDVVQDSLTKALHALRSSSAEIALGPWLATIVRNRSLNDLRDAPPPHEPIDDQFDGVPQPPAVAARREEVRAVVAAIAALPAQQRRALVGRELEGLSHEQIAAELGVTPGAARGLIFRARAGLREALGAAIPLPVVRFLMETGAAETTGGAAAGASAAVFGGTAGSKAAVGVLAVLATVGSGVAIERNLGDGDSARETQARAESGQAPDRGERSRDAGSGPSADRDDSGEGGGGRDAGARSSEGGETGADEGDSGPGGDGSSGPGSQNSGPGSESSGHGSGESSGPGSGEPEEDRSGHGGGGEAPEWDDNSGPGGGDEPEDPEPDEDSSGPGGGADDPPDGP